MRYRLLGRTGLRVSILGLGGSALGRLETADDQAEGIRAVHAALDLGINIVDTSPYYGGTMAETMLGRALRSVPRDRYLLATKVGRYGMRDFDFSAARVTRSVDESCARLGVETIDLLQCHDVEFADLNQVINETLPALVKIRQAGKIRFLGITGLPLKIFPFVLERTPPGLVDTVLSYAHYNLNDDSLATLLPRLQAFGVAIIHAAPTGGGMLTGARKSFWSFAPEGIVAGCRRAVDFCEAHGVDIAKIALQFSASNPAIATVLCGTAKSEEVRRNVAAVESPPDPVMLARVLEVLRPVHNQNFSSGGRPENQDPPHRPEEAGRPSGII